MERPACELETAQQNEAKLRETFLNKKKQAINLDTYKQQLKEIEQSFWRFAQTVA